MTTPSNRIYTRNIIDRACIIPVVINIKNIINESVSFQFNAMNNQTTLNKGNQYWEGCRIKNILELKPEGNIKIMLNAIVEDYGVYNLNRFQFKFYKDITKGNYLDPREGMKMSIRPFIHVEEKICVASALCCGHSSRV